MILTTSAKIAIARAAYLCVTPARRAFGKGDSVVVRRSKILWDLDLREGIDFSIYLLGAFEASTANVMRRLIGEGSVVLDIGANVGAHTMPLAKAVGPSGRVFAFEPTDFAFGKLKRNMALNPQLQERIRAEQVFLVAEESEACPPEIYASWPLEQSDQLHEKLRAKLVATTGAMTRKLDDYVSEHRIQRIDLIKLDVDGHELPVLAGGKKTLGALKPKIVMEMSPYVHAERDASFDEFIDLLNSFKYTLRDLRNNRQLKMDAKWLVKQVPDGASINVIAEVK